jgi:hypothetical protein
MNHLTRDSEGLELKTGPSSMLGRKRLPVVEAFLWLANIALVFLTTRYLFRMNSPGVFWGFDPQSFLALFGVQYRLSDVLFGFGGDFVMGLGNVSAPPNARWFPSVLLTWSTSGVIEDGPLAFAIGATELFAATLVCGRTLGFGLAVSIAAGWFITLWTWPLFVPPKIVTLFFFTPTHAEILSASVIITTAILSIAPRSIWSFILLTMITFLGLTQIVLGDPTFLALVAPVMTISGVIAVLFASTPAERLTILFCGAVVGIACLILGYAPYVWGLLAYTQSAFFPETTLLPHTLYGGVTTLLLWTPVSDLSATSILTAERLFVGGGIVGSIALLVFGSAGQRRLALTVLITEGVTLFVGFTNYFLNYWFGPRMWYYENMLFPYFALGFCFLVFLPAQYAWRTAQIFLPSSAFRRVPSLADRAVAILLPVLIGVYALAKGPIVSEQSRRYYTLASPFPQAETPITRILNAEARLVPGQPFRGRVAVIMGRFPQARDVPELASLMPFFSLLAKGNLHHGPGLWQDDIPTLFDFTSRLRTPVKYAFERYFLYSDDIGRSWRVHVDLRVLSAIGVRFIITDFPISGPKLRLELTIPTPPSAQQLIPVSLPTLRSFQLYLYELEDVNLGQFSPTEVSQKEDASSVLAALADTASDLSHTVFGVVPVSGPLRKADMESVTIIRDGYRIRASSEGLSMLLLPFEFSHCLNVVDRTAGPAPRVFRADLLLTGVLFDRRLDSDIVFRAGPGFGALCRLQDLDDANRIRLRNVFEHRPDAGPTGQ